MVNNRNVYEFSAETKQQAYERSSGKCEICGQPLGRDYNFHHEIAIWFAREVGGALPTVVIKSLANCVVAHKSCHEKIHKQESRRYYREKSTEVLERYLGLTADEQDKRDAWRYNAECGDTECDTGESETVIFDGGTENGVVFVGGRQLSFDLDVERVGRKPKRKRSVAKRR